MAIHARIGGLLGGHLAALPTRAEETIHHLDRLSSHSLASSSSSSTKWMPCLLLPRSSPPKSDPRSREEDEEDESCHKQSTTLHSCIRDDGRGEVAVAKLQRRNKKQTYYVVGLRTSISISWYYFFFTFELSVEKAKSFNGWWEWRGKRKHRSARRMRIENYSPAPLIINQDRSLMSWFQNRGGKLG